MSLSQCIAGLVAEGKIAKGEAQRIDAAYSRHFNSLKGSMSMMAAAAEASDRAIRQISIENAQSKRIKLLQVASQDRILGDLRSYAGGKGDGPIDPRAAKALFDGDGRATYSNVEARRKAIRGQAFGQMSGVLEAHRRNLVGVLRNREGLEKLARELFGESTGDVNARELADAFTNAGEWLRQRYNAAGGHIGKLDRWGLPQSHDSRAVRDAGFETWRDFILPRLDRERMVDGTGAPLSDEALDEALADVFETIRTDGWSKRKAGAAGGKALANQNAEHRFLHFQTADDWLSYQERFGSSASPFDAMVGHVEAMSRDIAAMEILGPNPKATVGWLTDTLSREASLDTSPSSNAVEAAHAAGKSVDRLWAEYSGESRRPESRKIALGFSGLRAFQTSAKLGSAVISAVTDVGWQALYRNFNGLPITGALSDYVKLLNPANAEDRIFATRAGLIAETWTSIAGGQHRYLSEELTGEIPRRLAEFTLRASGLNAWTDAGRWAFGMEFLNHVTLMRDRAFDRLDPAFAGALKRHGIEAADWDAIRSSPLQQHKGQGWIVPQQVKDGRAADKLLEMILGETDFAVPTANLTTRAMFSGAAPRGTWIGEILRSALLFKTFGVSIILMQGKRMLELEGGWNKARYAAGAVLATTAAGGLALQLKEIAKGRDPRPMDDPAFWGAAVLQGGGFGIFGDFINNAENRFGGGLGSTLAGPLAQTVTNIADATGGNLYKLARGDETDLGKDVTRLVAQEVPVASSLWYTRLAFERIVLDAMKEQLDPNYRGAWARMEKRAAEQGTDFWWSPGEDGPERAPDFMNAFGRDEAASADWGEFQ